MGKIANKFKSSDNINVHWHHSNGREGKIPGNNFETSAPPISSATESLTLEARDKSGGQVESKITLKEPFPEGHGILFSYEPGLFIWTIELTGILTWQSDVNVEIGPKNP
jgi:hypothetical protein